MKRTIRLLALILTLTLALSAAAMATDINYETGKQNATKSVSAVSLVDGCELKFDGDKLNVTYTNSALKEGDMVIVFLLETKDATGKLVEAVKTTEAAAKLIVPTAENIKYIDQSVAKATASNGSVTFDIYPQNHTSALVRLISVNAAGTLTDVNVAAVKLNYTLGDVDGNGKINTVDALKILVYSANGKDPKYAYEAPEVAGDANGDGTVNTADALRVLMYAVSNGDSRYELGKEE